jgi:hypothetical protein
MPRKTTRQIVEEQLPAMEMMPATRTAAAAAADVAGSGVKPGPSISQLRKKYLGSAANDGDDAEEDEIEAAQANADIDIALVRSKTTLADPADDPGPRTVIISKNRGMLGSQG